MICPITLTWIFIPRIYVARSTLSTSGSMKRSITVSTRPVLPLLRSNVIARSTTNYVIVSVDEKNANLVHGGLERVEEILSQSRYIVGDQLTEADVRLYTTMLRFDPVYFGHFKCNLLAVKDCPNILRWLREQFSSTPEIKETINMEHIKVGSQSCFLFFV